MESVVLRMWLALAALAACSSAAGQDANAEDVYRLERGDKVHVVVFGHEDLSGDFEVDGAGAISMPLIGNVAAAGASLNELEAAITDRLQPDYLKNPKVSARLLNYPPVYIHGEVNSPGSYPFEAGMTVINAVALAGGFTYRARKTRITISREEGGESRTFRATEKTALLPRDVIEVPERFF